METIQMLGIALGLATLAGLNLYLTVFVTGLAVQFGWVILPAEHSGLEILGDPWVIGVSGLLYFLEFFADKFPWVDSLNDTVHTAIRPIGGALLAVLALGEASPVVSVIAALIGGGAALTSHTAKATTRLVTNASPEPVSNIGLSLGEDAIVLGGLTLIAFSPVLAGLVAVVLLIVAWIFLPKLIRAMRATGWLAWRKLNTPTSEPIAAPRLLPPACESALRRAHATESSIKVAIPCISGGGPRLPKNVRGWLVRMESEPGSLYFVGPRLRGPLVVEIPVSGGQFERKTKFLCEVLSLQLPKGTAHKFFFERGYARLVDELAESASKPRIEPHNETPEPPAGAALVMSEGMPPESKDPSKSREPVAH